MSTIIFTAVLSSSLWGIVLLGWLLLSGKLCSEFGIRSVWYNTQKDFYIKEKKNILGFIMYIYQNLYGSNYWTETFLVRLLNHLTT